MRKDMRSILLHRTEHVLFGVHLNNHSQTPIWKQTGGALPLCTPCTPAYLPKTGAEPGRAGGTAIGASHLDSSSYYYITISLYHYITTSLYHYITISLYHYIHYIQYFFVKGMQSMQSMQKHKRAPQNHGFTAQVRLPALHTLHTWTSL